MPRDDAWCVSKCKGGEGKERKGKESAHAYACVCACVRACVRAPSVSLRLTLDVVHEHVGRKGPSHPEQRRGARKGDEHAAVVEEGGGVGRDGSGACV